MTFQSANNVHLNTNNTSTPNKVNNPYQKKNLNPSNQVNVLTSKPSPVIAVTESVITASPSVYNDIYDDDNSMSEEVESSDESLMEEDEPNEKVTMEINPTLLDESHWINVACMIKSNDAGVCWASEVEKLIIFYDRRYTRNKSSTEQRFFDTILEFGGPYLKSLVTETYIDHLYEKKLFYKVVSSERTEAKHAIIEECLKLCSRKWRNKRKRRVEGNSIP